MNRKLLDLLVCPLCKGPLLHHSQRLICRSERLAFPIANGVPLLTEKQAQALSLTEYEQLLKI